MAGISTGAALLVAMLGGAGAVAAEVVFTRKLALLFGVTAPAAAAVVAVYMAGMAVGAALGGRLADRAGRGAGALYVGAELVGAAWALAFPTLFALADKGTAHLPLSANLVAAGLVTGLLIGPAAVASGATFPALTRLLGQGDQVRRLYAANAGGAALGGLAAGLWAPELLGLSGTLVGAATLMAAAGLVGWAASRGRPVPPAAPEAAENPSNLGPGLATLSYAVIGGLGMGAEIGWTRLLEQTGPNPGSICFPMVLAAYLGGLALGGLLLEPRLRPLGDRVALGISALLAGVATAAAVGLLTVIPEERLLGHLVGPGPGNGLIFRLTGVQVSADRLAIYLLAVMLPGVASGVAFPIAAVAQARARRGLGQGVGLAGAAGIGAAVLVSLWMGFLPAPGPGTIRLTAMLGLGAALMGAALIRRPWALLLGLGTAGALAVPPWAGLQIPPGEAVLAFVETAAGPSAVTHGREDLVYTHGERVAGLQLELEVPLLLHSDPERVLVIAFGTGINIAGFLHDPAVKHLTAVDIDPALPGLARELPQVGRELFDGQRSTFVNADGRHLLRQSDQRWDIIYSDVATYAQYVSLGTVEFFELVRARLALNGLFTLKLHPDTLRPLAMRRFLATFLAVFPDAALFAAHSPVPVMVGFSGTHPDRAALNRRARSSDDAYGGNPTSEILAHTLLGASGLAALAQGPVATDDRPLSLRQALVGPIDEEALRGAAIMPLVAAGRSPRVGVTMEVFGEPAGRESPWKPIIHAIRPRRGWFVAPDGLGDNGTPVPTMTEGGR